MRAPGDLGSPTMIAAALTTIALLPGLLTGTVNDVKSETSLPILVPDKFTATSTRSTRPVDGDSPPLHDLARRGPGLRRRDGLLRRRLQREKGGKPFGRAQGDAHQGPQGPLPAAELRRLVLTAVDLVEGARRDLHDPGQGRRARAERKLLVKMANEAIRRGPR